MTGTELHLIGIHNLTAVPASVRENKRFYTQNLGMRLVKRRVEQDIRTTGGEGDSLVRGKVVRLQASALSFKDGNRGDALTVRGQVVAENPGTPAFDFTAPASVVGRVEVGGQPIT